MKTIKIFTVLLLILALSSSLAAEPRINVAPGDTPALGPANAPITIIEFLDFQ